MGEKRAIVKLREDEKINQTIAQTLAIASYKPFESPEEEINHWCTK